MSEPYSVVWPLGPDSSEQVAVPETSLQELDRVTLAELEHLDTKWFPIIRAALRNRYPSIKIIEGSYFGLTHGPHERDVIAEMPRKLRESKATAAVSGIGV